MAAAPESESPDAAALALRLHNGPLQSMFAGIMILENGSADATSAAIDVLRQGVRDLNDIIDALPD